MQIKIIGAGLAGCEAALWLADHGVQVDLYEQKPVKFSPAHKSAGFAELICSNSLKAERPDSASGLLKIEMRMMGSHLLDAAETARVAAGGALAVDRDVFSTAVTEMVEKNSGITVHREEVTALDESVPVLVASGPLTEGALAEQIAALTGDTGLLWSNEVVRNRAAILSSNLERMGVRNTVVSSVYPEMLAEKLGGDFDKVLVDAPCSGEGMFRRDPVAVQEWSPEHVETCAVRQLAILSSAAQCVHEGGILVYSTCTFSTEENEGVVQKFLESHPEFVLEKPNVTFGRPAYGVDAVRIFPMDGGEGHFAARFRRVAPCEERFAPFSFKPDRETQAHAEELYTSLFTDAPGRFQRVRDRVILLPNELPDIAGLSVLRAGVEFGEAKKNRIEPAHGIFMASRAENCRSVLHLTSNDPALFAFLRGEEIPAEGFSGYTAVAADGIVTGFGKASNGVLKNRYPKGLRTHL